ncbi:arabinose isomerase [Edaphobacter sp. 12200R-103]|uniref:arabinose isomerase n=1 Tax=Edaphobacter sp. 12200R-103 TaxID=2703788 RepID=UPI00192E96E0|nr:arabinose isomerase [Edaphobacter sp. 12200R-103]
MNHNQRKLRVGLMGIGLQAYWEQFSGLEQRLRSYVDVVAVQISGDSRSIVNFGLVDSPQKSIDTGHTCREQDIDILLVYLTTYALSSILLPVVLRTRTPIVLLNLQPAAAIDYEAFNGMEDRAAMTGEWLAYCSACPVPEIANVLTRLSIPFQQVTGMLYDDPACWIEIEQWLQAAEVVHALSHSNMGLMGHYYSGMLDIATDLAQVSGRFGISIEMLEVDELSAIRRSVSDRQIAEKVASFRQFFTVEGDCPEDEISRAARTSVALDRFVASHNLNLLAYYYKGTGVPENEDTMSSIILGTSMLTGNHVPVAGEYEVKNAIAMKIMDLLGAGGSFTEYYAMDFNDDIVLMGHDGPAHPGIAQDRIKVRPLRVYHGKVGRGLSVEMAVQHGPVTLLSVVEHSEKGFCLVVAEGESVPGPILQIGNTNSRYRFPQGARGFVEQWNALGPAHHCAVGLGHHASPLRKIASLFGLPCIEVGKS